jgi:uncharacterized membrane protein
MKSMPEVAAAVGGSEEADSHHRPTVPGVAPEGSPGPPRWRVSWDWIALFALVAGYAAIMTYFSSLRAENFYTSAWDLGINQQLLWTGAHGRLLYEAADLEFYNAHSYLQVHSAYVAYLVVPIYSAAPYPVTLFAIQSAVFAASAIPLYYFPRKIVARPWLALSVVAVYLGSFGVISSLSYDFHWESFLPLEFLTFFLLLRRDRFLLSLVPLAVGTMTLEVFPFLAGGAILFFLIEHGERLRGDLSGMFRDGRFRLLVAMAAVALAVYLMVRLFQYVVIPDLLGVASTTGGGPSGLASVIGFGANSVTFPHSAAYWLLLLATFGFLPLLRPRYLVLSLPWFLYSVIVSPIFSANFGDTYALVAVPPLALGFVEAVGTIERSAKARGVGEFLLFALLAGSVVFTLLATVGNGSARFLNYTAGPTFWAPVLTLFALSVVLAYWIRRPAPQASETETPLTRGRLARRRLARPILVGLFVTLLLFDAVMTPMNPANFEATPIPGYQFSWGQNPMAGEMGWVTSHLPAGAQVLASDRLFPYVANDAAAWPIPWYVISSKTPVPYFPFTPADLPEFVLTDNLEFGVVPTFLATELFNSSIYGLVAYAYMPTYPGTVYLFEHGYTGPPAVRVVVPALTQYVFGATNLTAGPAGRVVSNGPSLFGRVITSVPVGPTNQTLADIWGGPYLPVRPGLYRITFSVSGNLTNSSVSGQPLGYLGMNWNAGTDQVPLLQSPVYATNLSASGWTQIEFTLNLTAPYPLVEFRGFLALDAGRSIGTLTLNYVEMEPAGP